MSYHWKSEMSVSEHVLWYPLSRVDQGEVEPDDNLRDEDLSDAD
jgi:hypothetical protein